MSPRIEETHIYKIGETRANLPLMVNNLQTGESSGYIVGRYGKPSVALVSFERFRPLLTDGSKEERFAMLIADELLTDAPLHLWTAAINELSGLPESDLLNLWKLTSASPNREISSIREQMQHPEVLDRLIIRIRAANAVREARLAGLNERAENLASDAI